MGIRSVFLAVLAVSTGLGAPAANARQRPVVTVFAAASLREAFDAAASAFTKRSGYAVRLSYGGSDTLAAQLQEGAPADVFASADPRQMERVAALVEPPRVLARNRPVAIVARDAPVHDLRDLAKPGTTVVLAAPAVPIGAYARAALARLDADPAYGAGFAARVAANVVSEETDVKAVATKVALGEADAGVVYATDVTPRLAPRLRVLPFPPHVAPEAVYPIAVVRHAPEGAGAHAFVAFITSPDGRAFLRARGFAE